MIAKPYFRALRHGIAESGRGYLHGRGHGCGTGVGSCRSIAGLTDMALIITEVGEEQRIIMGEKPALLKLRDIGDKCEIITYNGDGTGSGYGAGVLSNGVTDTFSISRQSFGIKRIRPIDLKVEGLHD
jgi:hypothetical protein